MNVRMAKIREEWLPLIMDWRMRPEITKYMNTDPVLTLEGQRAWFKKIMADETQRHWVILLDERPIGVIQLVGIDAVNKRCSVGWYIAERENKPSKLAVYLRYNLNDYAFERLQLNKLCDEIFAENERALSVNLYCGGKKEGLLRQHICKNGQYHDVVVVSILKDEWRQMRETLDYPKFEFE